MGAPEITFPVTTMLVKEIAFKGSFRYGVRAHLCCMTYNTTKRIVAAG